VSEPTCVYPGCTNTAQRRGLCWGHSSQRQRGLSLRPLHMQYGPPLPFTDLERFLATDDPALQFQTRGTPRLVTDPRIARACGVERRTVLRWRQRDAIRLTVAEQVADRLGAHPAEIWGSYYEVAA
jgi:hypothetical protein